MANLIYLNQTSDDFDIYPLYLLIVRQILLWFADMTCITNGYLDTKIDWVPGLLDMTLKDFPTFFRTTDPNDIMLNFILTETAALPKARALILNTFDTLEQDPLNAISATQPHIYTLGPLHLM